MTNKLKRMSGRRGAAPQGARGSAHPSPFTPEITIRKVFRYKASAALADVAVLPFGIVNAITMATTTTSARSIIAACRVRRVEMWGPMAADLVPVTVSLEWNKSTTSGGTYSATSTRSDTSMGSAEPAHLVASPPVESQADFWNREDGGGLFVVNGPSGTLVDLTVDIVLRARDGAGTAITVAGATVGQLYSLPLDLPGSTSSGLLIPVGYFTA